MRFFPFLLVLFFLTRLEAGITSFDNTSNSTTPPNSNIPQYAVIDLGAGMSPVGINDGGMALLNSGGVYFSWQNGTPTPLGTTPCAGPLQDGTIVPVGGSVDGSLDPSLDGDLFTEHTNVLIADAILAANSPALALMPPITSFSSYSFGNNVNDHGDRTFAATEGATEYTTLGPPQPPPADPLGYWPFFNWNASSWGVSPGPGNTTGTQYGYTSGYSTLGLGGLSDSNGNFWLTPLEANVQGVVTATDNHGTYYYIPSAGATPVALPNCAGVIGLTESVAGSGQGPYTGKGPYFLATTTGSSNTQLYYNGGASHVDLGETDTSNGYSSVTGRFISNHLFIPMGGQVWCNGTTKQLTDLCPGATNNWSGLTAQLIAPGTSLPSGLNTVGTDIMVGTATQTVDSNGHPIPAANQVTHGILFLPLSLTLLNGSTSDFDGNIPTSWIPSPEFPNYNDCVTASGVTYLGPLAVGASGSGRLPGGFYYNLMVAAKAPANIPGIQFRWKRYWKGRQWYLIYNSSTGDWDVSNRGAWGLLSIYAPNNGKDDTGPPSNNVPSATKHEFYAADSPGLGYGSDASDSQCHNGDCIDEEETFTYKVQYSFDGANWQDGTSLVFHHQITVQLKQNYTGNPTSDLNLITNATSNGDNDPTMTLTKAAFVTGSGHINLEPNVNIQEN